MAYKNNRNNRNYRQTYIDGNVVRRMEAAPQYQPTQPKPQKSREQIERDKARRRAARRNQQRELSMNMGYVAFLTMATAVCFAICVLFLSVQAQITTRMEQIASLETQIAEQRADNDAASKRLETIMNLDEVKASALSMGLTYPASEQIHYYSVENSDYMNQYGDIPSN